MELAPGKAERSTLTVRRIALVGGMELRRLGQGTTHLSLKIGGSEKGARTGRVQVSFKKASLLVRQKGTKNRTFQTSDSLHTVNDLGED